MLAFQEGLISEEFINLKFAFWVFSVYVRITFIQLSRLDMFGTFDMCTVAFLSDSF
jgi:hypothetical protein